MRWPQSWGWERTIAKYRSLSSGALCTEIGRTGSDSIQFDDEGNLKWQLFALYVRGLLLFYSAHYGAEMHVFGVSEEDEVTLRKAVRGELRKSPLRRAPIDKDDDPAS